MNCCIIAEFVGHAPLAGNNYSALVMPEAVTFRSLLATHSFLSMVLVPHVLQQVTFAVNAV